MREPEPDLLQRARRGDVRAFEWLVRAYQADVWRFVHSLTRDPGLSDDVTQEVFLHAFRALRSYRGEAKFTTWLLRIARNCAIDAQRVRRRQARLAERLEADARKEGPVARDPSVSGARSWVRQSIDALPSPLREAFVVIEVLGFSYAEASVILDTNVGTLKSRMYRARARLVESLIGEEAAGEM